VPLRVLVVRVRLHSSERGYRVSRYGDFYENRITGERAVVLRGDDDSTAGQSALAHLIVAPDGAVAGEHLHPQITERFAVISGTLSTRLDGVDRELRAGEEATAPPGMTHDWWNAGREDASVLVEVAGPREQASRFEAMIGTMFGLGNDGKTNAKGLPSLPQLALLAQEFDDVIRFTSPPRALQPALFGVLGAVGRTRGMRALYPEYLHPHGQTVPDPAVVAFAGITPPADAG
jgi:mannose-6-phosphate isomerase-like protein (cupin superfamily)